MKKTIALFAMIVFAVIILLNLSACNPILDNDDMNSINSIGLGTESQGDSSLNILVRDVYFNPVPNVDIYFVMYEKVYAGTSNDEGTIVVYLKNTKGNSLLSRLKDFFILDTNIFNFVVVTRPDYNHHSFEIVCAKKDSDIDVFNLVDLSNKVSFYQSDLKLPKSYYHRGVLVTTTEAGDTVIRGVEFYIGDNLIGVGNDSGFGLYNIYPTSIITVKKNGFTFVDQRDLNNAVPLVAVDKDGVSHPDSFIAPYQVFPFPYEIRGVLNEGLDLETLEGL